MQVPPLPSEEPCLQVDLVLHKVAAKMSFDLGGWVYSAILQFAYLEGQAGVMSRLMVRILVVGKLTHMG